MKRKNGDQDEKRPAELGGGQPVGGLVVEVRLKQLYEGEADRVHRRYGGREAGPVEVEPAERRRAFERVAQRESAGGPGKQGPPPRGGHRQGPGERRLTARGPR